MALTRPRAAQIYNLDYKQATRVVTVTNVTLSGGAPAQVDGVNLATNDRVLVTGQNTASQNGIYDVVTVGTGSNGTWARTSDANSTGEIDAGMIVMVTEGAVYHDTQWKLITDNPITIGVTGLVFTQNYSANSISGGTSNVTVYSNANVTISSAGTPNVLTISSTGVVVSGTISATGNITGNYILGNGSQLTGLPATYSNANVATFLASFGSNTISTTGNITGGKIIGNILNGTTTITAVANTTYQLTANSTPVQIFTGNVSGSNVRLPDATTCALGQSFTIINLTGSNLAVQTSAVGLYGSATSAITFIATVSNTAVQNGYTVSWQGSSYTGTGGSIVFSNSPTFGTIYPTAIDTGGGGSLTMCQSSATLNIGGSALAQTINFWPTATGNATYTRILNLATSGGLANTVINIGNVANATVNIRGATNFANAVTANSTISATGNVTGGNVLTAGIVSSTGNIIGGNLITDGYVNATANVSGGNLYAASGINTSGYIFAPGNITGGNVLTGGFVTATGNVTGGNLTSLGFTTVVGNITGGNVLTAGQVSATGNVSGNYFIGNGSALTGIVASAGAAIVNGTSNVTVASNSNVTIGIAGSTVATFATTGEYVTGIISATGDITSSGNINGVNLNSTHADLAELYIADADYPPGTVMEFGGNFEITAATSSHSTAVAGIISTAPGHLMNSQLKDKHALPLALTGRVPCRVVGTIFKGDRLVASGISGVATALDSTQYQPGCIIGKALENYNSISDGVIEVAVGRF
jgi:hypothetical protein